MTKRLHIEKLKSHELIKVALRFKINLTGIDWPET